MNQQPNKIEGGSCELPPSMESRFQKPASKFATTSYHDKCIVSRLGSPSPAERQDHAVQLRHNGRSYIVGKILYLQSRRPVFYCQLRETDVLKNMDALSVAPEILDHLEALGGTEIHLFAPWVRTLYVANVSTIRSKGVLASMNAAIGTRYHLPRTYWTKAKLTYQVPYLQDVVTLDAYPKPAQLELFEEGAP